MKWYTFEERPLEKGVEKRYLMAGIYDDDEYWNFDKIWFDIIWMNPKNNLVYERDGKWEIMNPETIIAYIPIEEIKSTLPLDMVEKFKEKLLSAEPKGCADGCSIGGCCLCGGCGQEQCQPDRDI